MSKSTSIVGNSTTKKAVNAVSRGSLKVGDLFKNQDGGKVYMHTGVRTIPPSERGGRKSWGRTAAGKDIIAFQGLVVRGDVADGEDGSVVTFDGAKLVTLVGSAMISPAYFA